jgi:glycosyltransferase involved in cell wall biosynthesis
VPFIFEVRDLWPQTLIDMGRLSENGYITKTLRILERWLYTRADKIIVLLPTADEYIEQLGIPTDKIIWIPNGVDLDDYPEPKQPRRHAGFTLMYLGAHGQANGLDCLLQAMAELKNNPEMANVCLRLIGDGPLKLFLQQQAKSLNLTNVIFENPVPKHEIPSVAASADAFVLLVRDLPRLYRYGISMNKIFDYFAAARPTVIASAAVNNPVIEAAAGLTVSPEAPILLAKAIEALVVLPEEEREALGLAGRKFVVDNHGFEKLTIKLVSVLDDLIASKL